MNTAAKAHSHVSAPAAMTPVKGFLTLVAVVVVLAAFLVLSHFAGITETWAAFLFLLYWGGIQHTNMEQLPGTVLGSIIGLLLAYLFQQSPVWFGSAGGNVFLCVILVVVYFQIMGWLSVAVNMAGMLYLMVGTIPAVQSSFNFIGALIGLIAGVAYFAGLMWAAGLFKRTRPATA